MVAMTVPVWLKRKLAEPTTIHGISVLCALGAGFALSAAASYYLSKSFGLLNGAGSHGQ